MAAAAGPSQFTNHDVAAVTRLPGGPKLLANCVGLWLRGSVCEETVKLWTTVRMVALDEGWAKPCPDEEPESRRKLQPVACAELFLKFAQTVVIEEGIKDVVKKLEPRQDTGCCATDGETHEVMGRGHPDKHSRSRNATYSERHHTPQEHRHRGGRRKAAGQGGGGAAAHPPC